MSTSGFRPPGAVEHSHEFPAAGHLRSWVRRGEWATSVGFDGLRLAADVSWMGKTGRKTLVDYEALVGDAIGGHRIVAICAYASDRFSAGDVIDVARLHQSVVARREGEWAVLEDTDRGRTERALQESERRALATFEEAAAGVVNTTPDRRMLRVNKKYADMLGYPQSELLVKTYREITHPDDLENGVESVRRLLAGEIQTCSYEKRFLRRDGSAVWSSLTVSLVRDQLEEPDYFIVIVNDISERKRAEEALRESEERYRSLVEVCPEPIFVHSEGRFVYLNAAAASLFGVAKPDQLVGRTVLEFAHEDDREAIGERARHVSQSGGLPPAEAKIVRLDGRVRLVETTGVLIAYGGKPAQQAVLRDITERKRAEEEIGRLAEESAVLAEIGRIMSSSLDIDEVYKRFSDEVLKLIPFDRIEIGTVDHDNGTFTRAYVGGHDVPGKGKGSTVLLAGTHTGVVVGARSGVIAQGEDEDELRIRYPGSAQGTDAGLQSFLAVPLTSTDEVVGVLSFGLKTPNAYTEADVALAERVGTQIAGAIANARLHAELQREATERETMAEIGRIISSSLDIDEVYEPFAAEVRKLIPFDRIAVNTVDFKSGTYTPAYLSGVEIPEMSRGETRPLGVTHLGAVARDRSVLLVQGESEEELLRQNPTLLPGLRAGLRSFLTVALTSKDEVIGVLTLRSKAPNAYTRADVALAERVGTQIAGAIANASLHAELRREATERETMAEIGRIINSSLDVAEVYERFAAEVRKLIPCDRISINTTDLADGTHTTAYVFGSEVPGRPRGEVRPLAGTHTGAVVRAGSGLLVQNQVEGEFQMQHPGLLPGFRAGLRSFLSVSLVTKGEVVGALHLQSKTPNAYADADVALAERVGMQIAGAIAGSRLYDERVRAEGTARRLAHENEVLAEIGRVVNSSLDMDEVYERFTDQVRKLIEFDGLQIAIADLEQGSAEMAYVSEIDVPGRRRRDNPPSRALCWSACCVAAV